MKEQVYEVVSPVGKPACAEGRSLAPRLATLEGKTIGQVWNGGFRGDASFPIIAQMLRERFPGVKVVPYAELPLSTVTSLKPATKAQTLEAVRAALLEKGCDAVIAGNGF